MNLQKLFREVEQRPGYWMQDLYLSLISAVERGMQERKMSRTEFALRIEAAPSWVTRLFKSEANVTLRTIARIALALGKRPVITLLEPDEEIIIRKKSSHPKDATDTELARALAQQETSGVPVSRRAES